jgi:hypothetical protein
MLITQSLKKFGSYEKHFSYTSYFKSNAYKLTIAYFLNTGIIIIIAILPGGNSNISNNILLCFNF